MFNHDFLPFSDVNECELGTIDCDVNSNCTNTEGSYTCICHDGYFDSDGGRAREGDCQGEHKIEGVSLCVCVHVCVFEFVFVCLCHAF